MVGDKDRVISSVYLEWNSSSLWGEEECQADGVGAEAQTGSVPVAEKATAAIARGRG